MAGEPTWGKDSFIPRFQHADAPKPFAVYTNGSLELKMAELPESFAGKLREYLRQDAGLDLTHYTPKYPRLPIDVWGPILPEILTVFERLLK